MPADLQRLIAAMAAANRTWGEERIASELLVKLGIRVSPRTVRRYMSRGSAPRGGARSQAWSTFVRNHASAVLACDFCVAITATFRVFYVFVVLDVGSRRIVHWNTTEHPTAEWTAQQLREALPWDSAPRYLLRDRDRIFGHDFVEQVKAMGIKQILSAPGSPWQRAYVERVIGTIRRECLDHMVVFNESSLSRHLQAFASYYHRTRTHLALEKDAPDSRTVQLPSAARIISIPEVGGLHHRYERRAA